MLMLVIARLYWLCRILAQLSYLDKYVQNRSLLSSLCYYVIWSR